MSKHVVEGWLEPSIRLDELFVEHWDYEKPPQAKFSLANEKTARHTRHIRITIEEVE